MILTFGNKTEAVISIIVSCEGQMNRKANIAETLNVDLVMVELLPA